MPAENIPADDQELLRLVERIAIELKNGENVYIHCLVLYCRCWPLLTGWYRMARVAQEQLPQRYWVRFGGDRAIAHHAMQ